jgi:hypothetical protein
MSSRRRQDELSRRRRLNRGLCPTHGVVLLPDSIAYDKNGVPYGETVRCSRQDCDWWIEVRPGTKLWEALYPDKEKTA